MNRATLLITGLVGLCIAGCGQSETPHPAVPEGFESVRLVLETVTLVKWERVDSAFRYRVEADGAELANGVGNRRYFRHEGPFENLRITASSFRGDPLGEAQLESTEKMERLVLYWDETAFSSPFLGVRTDDGEGGSGSTVLGLTESPSIIGSDPTHVKVVLFGEGVANTDDRIVPSPFSFEDGGIVEYGPFIQLDQP